MASNTTIRIREKTFENNIFTLTITFRDADGHEEENEVRMPNLYDEGTDKLLEWHFEKYISTPYDDVKVKDAEQAIEDYGIQLFNQLFTGEDIKYRYRTALQQDGPENLTIEIVGDSPAFQGIYWESLRDPKQTHPLAAEGTVFLRKNLKPLNIKATVEPSPTINLLIVTARPNEENDVNYRTIQRPLIDLIEETTTPIQPHILRPGTYEALVKHLDQKAGYYHIIHFDLHGSLLDFPTYQQFKEAVDKAPFHNALYKGGYALQELKEEDFNQGKKAFLFFESEEKGVAVPVDAEQLAGMLEHKQIPICMLNACQSAKQEYAEHETSLGRVLMQKGMQLVLAMRYSVSVSAAKLMMQTLYQQIYKDIPIEKAIAGSRKELYRDKERRATYNYSIELEDWLLPVVYQNGKPAFHLREFEPEEEEAFVLQKQIPEEAKQELPYSFFGRDLDILKIEKNLLVRNNILLLQGMGGAGKTTLLKYLAAWWLRTGFVQKVFYFGYDIKAYTLNEIIYHIAQEIYSKEEYGIFTALQPTVQENRIVKELKANRYALMLDNTESITGEKLAIPHTLPEEDRKALKQFLSQLKGGQSVVLIGSRASEDWLKSGTFNNNYYLLKGLDHESATNFAQEIIQDIGLSIENFANDTHFERLMKLLAGYPLALKAILPNLKQKTPKHILKELEEGVGDLDKENVQEKSESIIKCIEYAYNNLSEEGQQLLLCLAPFQTVVNVSPDFIKVYFEALQKDPHFQNYPFDKLEAVVQEGIQNGFMQEALPGFPIRLMSLQPVFTFFLKNKLNAENATLQQSLQIAFISYYQQLSKVLEEWLKSKESQEQQIGLLITEYEYENLYQALRILLAKQESIFKVFRVIDEYLYKKQLQQKRIHITDIVYDKMQQYETQKLEGEIVFDLFEIKLKLATNYQDLKQYDQAIKIYHKCLTLLAANSVLKLNLKDNLYNQAVVHINLGNIARNQGDFPSAIDYHKKALAIYGQFQDVYNQGHVYRNLGNIAQEQEDFPSAMDYHKKALAIYGQFQDIYNLGKVCHNLSFVLTVQKDYITAKDYLDKALKIFVQFQDVYSQGRVYQSLGLVSAAQKDYTTTKDYFEKSLKIFVQFQDVYSQGRIYQNLGLASEVEGDYTYAKKYYEKALDIFLEFPENSDSFVEILAIIYDFVKETKDKAFGQAMFQKALPYFEGEEKEKLQKMLDDINNM